MYRFAFACNHDHRHRTLVGTGVFHRRADGTVCTANENQRTPDFLPLPFYRPRESDRGSGADHGGRFGSRRGIVSILSGDSCQHGKRRGCDRGQTLFRASGRGLVSDGGSKPELCAWLFGSLRRFHDHTTTGKECDRRERDQRTAQIAGSVFCARSGTEF